MIEKAKTCGGHIMSGAVVRPEPLQELFPDLSREDWRKERFAFGEVTKEAVYLVPNEKRAIKVPTPPNFKNHGNEVISVAALARYQQKVAEEAGAYVLTETAATRLIVETVPSLASALVIRDAARTVSRCATLSPAPTSRLV